MFNKNLFKLSLVGISSLALLSACGEEGEGTTDTEATGETVEIEFWYGLGSVAGETMEEIIQEFNDSQDQYHVTGVQQADYGETFQNIQAAIASDTAPGLALLGVEHIHALAGSQALEPLNEYVERDDFDLEDYTQSFTDILTIDGNLYGLPAWATTQVMYYNIPIFEEAGIDPEEAFASWENLIEAAEEIQAGGYADYGFAPLPGSGNISDIALSNGGTILNEDGTEVMIDSPEWIEAWETIRIALHEDEIFKMNSGGEGWEYWYRTIDEVLEGHVAGYIGSSGDKGDLDFDIIGSAVQPGMNGNSPAPVAGANNLAVPSSISDEEKEAGFAFAAFFTDIEAQNKWTQTIGYIPVRAGILDDEEYQAYVEETPAFDIPFQQSQHATSWLDPTGGQINDAISIAADQVLLENIPAAEALEQAKEAAQEALDAHNGE
jgi:multiple sugar transport system substrate-binding protein